MCKHSFNDAAGEERVNIIYQLNVVEEKVHCFLLNCKCEMKLLK